jgi:DnaJ-like protein
VIELPSSLDGRTLGDVLGVLHRNEVSGTLCLDELDQSRRRHTIHWREGLIYDIETSLPVRPLGDRRLERLDALFGLTRVRLSFSAMARSRRAFTPLRPHEFLHGRPRARERQHAPAPMALCARNQALQTLGLALGASASDVRAAFKALARRFHPDLHPGADAATKKSLGAEFARVALAYQTLKG